MHDCFCVVVVFCVVQHVACLAIVGLVLCHHKSTCSQKRDRVPGHSLLKAAQHSICRERRCPRAKQVLRRNKPLDVSQTHRENIGNDSVTPLTWIYCISFLSPGSWHRVSLRCGPDLPESLPKMPLSGERCKVQVLSFCIQAWQKVRSEELLHAVVRGCLVFSFLSCEPPPPPKQKV